MTWIQFIQYAAYPALMAVAALAWAAMRKADAAIAELNAYKLQVAKEYASNGYLKDVEARMLVTMNEIKDSIKEIIREMRRPHGGAE